jgi:peptide-methionine (R)-S-oxide reductase
MAKPWHWLSLALGAVLLGVVFHLLEQGSGGTTRERRGVPIGGRVEKTDAEWRNQLSPEQYRVTRQKATERPFTGIYCNTKQDGIYQCACCGQPLFDSQTKFECSSGWPSFWQPVNDNMVSLVSDNSWLMHRTEVICSRCDAHLGHVFPDGPRPTGMRYCMNSAALKLVERERGTTAAEQGSGAK